MEDLRIPIISQELAKSYSATSKKVVKRKSKFVQPGALEAANKKRLRSQGLPHAASHPTHVPPPTFDHVADPPPPNGTPLSPTHVPPSTFDHVADPPPTPPPPPNETPPSPTHVTPSPTDDIPSLGSGDDDVDEELNITDKKKLRYWRLKF